MQHPRPRDVALPATLTHPQGDAYAVLGLDPAADPQLVELALRHHLETCARDLPDGPERRERLERLHRAWTALSTSGAPVAAASLGSTTDPYRVLCVHPQAGQSLITIAYRWLLRRAAERGAIATFEALECAYARIGTAAARARHDAEASQPAARRTPQISLPAIGGTLAGVQDGLVRRIRLPSRSIKRFGGGGAPPMNETPIPAAEGPEVMHPVGALRVLEGGREVMTVDLADHASYTIGAGPGAAIRLPGAEREHAQLTAGQGWVLFQQLAEHTVSLVNGARAVRALLGPGDQLEIGPYRCQYIIARYEARGWGV